MRKFFVADCRKVLPKVSGVDMVLTDPPFAISRGDFETSWCGYKSHKGDWDWTEAVGGEWVHMCCDALRPGGVFCCFGVFGSLMPIWQVLEVREDMQFQSHIVWHKTNPTPSVHRRMLTHANEIILLFSKGPKWYFDYALSKEYGGGKQLHNVWEGPAARRKLTRPRKPPWLLERLVRLFCPEDGIILDPFAGTGGVLEAANAWNRNWIAIEIDPEMRSVLLDVREDRI